MCRDKQIHVQINMHLGRETTSVPLCVFLAYKATAEAVSLDYTEGSERPDVCQSFVALLHCCFTSTVNI